MHEAGVASWQVSSGQPQSLAVALFIRDAAALPSRHSWIPPALPAVRPVGSQAREPAGLQWDSWWDQALRQQRQVDPAEWPPDVSSYWAPPDFHALDATPELQEIVAAHHFEAARWSNDRAQEHAATMLSSEMRLFYPALVRNMEHALNRKAQPFDLMVTEIPVDGQQLWRLGPDHVLVTAGLLRDPALALRRLTPVIQALL